MAETVQPVGGLEEILVEKLAMLVWRYRRLLQAEAGEVERQAEFCEHEYMERKRTYMITGLHSATRLHRAKEWTKHQLLEEIHVHFTGETTGLEQVIEAFSHGARGVFCKKMTSSAAPQPVCQVRIRAKANCSPWH
jgi:hypothetical protein